MVNSNAALPPLIKTHRLPPLVLLVHQFTRFLVVADVVVVDEYHHTNDCECHEMQMYAYDDDYCYDSDH